MSYAGRVTRLGDRSGAYRVLIGRPEGKRPLGRPRSRWDDDDGDDDDNDNDDDAYDYDDNKNKIIMIIIIIIVIIWIFKKWDGQA